MYSLKDLLKLQKRAVRQREGVFLIEGKKIIAEAVAAGQEFVLVVASESFAKNHPEFLHGDHSPISSAVQKDDGLMLISDHNAERLTSAKTHAGIFAVVKKPPISLADLQDKTFIAVFEDIKDPGNLGTMIRTADWFGVDAIITTTNGVDPYNDKVLRSTMGSIFHLPILTTNDLIADLTTLQQHGVHLIVSRPEVNESPAGRHLNTFMTATTPSDPAPTAQPAPQPRFSHFSQDSQLSKLALIIGNESLGTSPEIDQLADSFISIPGFGQAESLNASVSFGILLWQLKNQ